MKRQLVQLLVIIACISNLSAQDLGKVIIRNAQPSYPRFIASLNGIRLTNEYNSVISFDYLEEKNYKVKLLQAGSSKVFSFAVNSAPNYISSYILSKDNFGNYALVLESKALMNGQHEDQAPVPNQDVPPQTTIIMPMPEADYNDMLKSVKKESLESGKLDMAKTFFGNQNLSSTQVLGILKVFSLENSKISFAKFAYSRTVDKQNYYKVYDAFSLSGSKKDMSEYIKNNP